MPLSSVTLAMTIPQPCPPVGSDAEQQGLGASLGPPQPAHDEVQALVAASPLQLALDVVDDEGPIHATCFNRDLVMDAHQSILPATSPMDASVMKSFINSLKRHLP